MPPDPSPPPGFGRLAGSGDNAHPARVIRDRDLDASIELLRRVGRAEVMPLFRALPEGAIDTKSGPDDLVTVADRAAEAAIADGIARILPDAAIVGEEATAADPGILDRIGRDGTCVIVDPIDGTSNYARGLATFGMILAVTVDGTTRAGVLYDPVMDDWVVATLGGGAWYVRPGAAPRRLRASPACPVEGASGYMSIAAFPAGFAAALASAWPDAGRIDNLRCSCHEWRMLALGQTDFLIAGALKPWDHAAGVLVAQEAGAHVSLSGGGSYAPTIHEGRLVAATGAALAGALHVRLDRALDAARPGAAP